MGITVGLFVVGAATGDPDGGAVVGAPVVGDAVVGFGVGEACGRRNARIGLDAKKSVTCGFQLLHTTLHEHE